MVDQYPEDIKNKIYLLKHFEGYIMNKLWGGRDYQFQDVNRTKGMEWVQKYLRMKHVIVFKLSHDVLQVSRFGEPTLIVLISWCAVYLTRWTLSGIMARALNTAADSNPDENKFFQRLLDKLHYCKEVLLGIRTASRAEDGAHLVDDFGSGTKVLLQ
jgi:cell cycle serine/threonine-protein kinase CDC5/MSD2